ncbi:hypothetical protein L6452_33681 [Arctium lappa]|uniref:Uncharacterized protein n=1 Tax=Arctium lappa TaxID=4217 RepID=A0ACB8YFG9_ARCLA|nr:hypothetical protein L6452_33681 [Arctium lappa]
MVFSATTTTTTTTTTATTTTSSNHQYNQPPPLPPPPTVTTTTNSHDHHQQQPAAATTTNYEDLIISPRFVSKGCKLVGCGSALPNLQVSNDDLAKIIDASDEWIFSRTGIRNRRILSDSKRCKGNPPAFDIRAACSGFILGLVSASCYIRGGGFKNVLVIGADCISRYVDWTDKKTCVLFGDGAGAVIVQACDIEEDGLFDFDLHTDGNGNRHLNSGINDQSETNLANTSVMGFPTTHSSISHIQMNGPEVFRFAVKAVPQTIEASLAKVGG